MDEKDLKRRLELQKKAVDEKLRHKIELMKLDDAYSEGVAKLAKTLREEKQAEAERHAAVVLEIERERQEIRFRRDQEEQTKTY